MSEPEGHIRLPEIQPQLSLGFAAWRNRRGHMVRPHVHPDIEFNFVLKGSLEYLMADGVHTIGAGTLGVFWAGMPHLAIGVAPHSDIIWVVVPFSWFLQWDLPSHFTSELMSGRIARYSPPDELESLLFGRWCEDLNAAEGQQPDQEAHRIVTLEVEACLRRMARQAHVLPREPEHHRASAGEGSQLEQIAAYIGRHYADEDLSVGAVAEAVGLHPNYVMQMFRVRFGASLWEYVLRLRISHAQYLLLTSQKKISQIAWEAGFSSPARFYTAFSKYVGATPRAWRTENARKSAPD